MFDMTLPDQPQPHESLVPPADRPQPCELSVPPAPATFPIPPLPTTIPLGTPVPQRHRSSTWDMLTVDGPVTRSQSRSRSPSPATKRKAEDSNTEGESKKATAVRLLQLLFSCRGVYFILIMFEYLFLGEILLVFFLEHIVLRSLSTLNLMVLSLVYFCATILTPASQVILSRHGVYNIL